jgi:hypothetical protein
VSSSSDRDGFVIRDFDGNEVHFIACTYDGSVRERVERGLLMKTRDDLIVADTRLEQEEAPDA